MASARPATPTSPRAQRVAVQRSEFLDVAEEMFAAHGFYDTTLKQIAGAAGWSVGSTYSFFSSKEDLIGQIFLRRGGENMEMLRSEVRARTAPSERLRRLGETQVEFFAARPYFARLVVRHLNADVVNVGRGFAQAAIAANYAEVVELLAELFRAGQRSGEFCSGDPRALARLWIGMVGAFHAIDATDAPRVVTFGSDELLDLVDRAFAPPGRLPRVTQPRGGLVTPEHNGRGSAGGHVEPRAIECREC